MRQVFCNTSGRIAPIVLFTLSMTLLAAPPARAQNMTILGVTTEPVTGELLISGGPFAAGFRLFTGKGELNVKEVTPAQVRVSPPGLNRTLTAVLEPVDSIGYGFPYTDPTVDRFHRAGGTLILQAGTAVTSVIFDMQMNSRGTGRFCAFRGNAVPGA